MFFVTIETHVGRVHWVGDKGHVVFEWEGATEHDLGQVAKVEARIDEELLVGKQGLEQR